MQCACFVATQLVQIPAVLSNCNWDYPEKVILAWQAFGSQSAETNTISSVVMMDGSPSVFILCHDAVPPERSTAWVKGVLSEIIPEQ